MPALEVLPIAPHAVLANFKQRGRILAVYCLGVERSEHITGKAATNSVHGRDVVVATARRSLFATAPVTTAISSL